MLNLLHDLRRQPLRVGCSSPTMWETTFIRTWGTLWPARRPACSSSTLPPATLCSSRARQRCCLTTAACQVTARQPQRHPAGWHCSLTFPFLLCRRAEGPQLCHQHMGAHQGWPALLYQRPCGAQPLQPSARPHGWRGRQPPKVRRPAERDPRHRDLCLRPPSQDDNALLRGRAVCELRLSRPGQRRRHPQPHLDRLVQP